MPRRQPPDMAILDLIHDEAWDRVAAVFATIHPADIAEIINHAHSDAHERLFGLIPNDIKPEVLTELEGSAVVDVLGSLSNVEISDIVEEMAPDDAADVLSDLLPEARSEAVLQLMEKDESEDVRKLLTYDEESAGGIMTTDVVAMRANQTVEAALQAIAYMDTKEQFYHAHIVDANSRLIGYVDIWELLRIKNRSRPLGDLVHTDFIAANVGMDQEEAAQLMSKYDSTVLPVVDAAGHLVGRITADDVMEVMEEEASEDIFRLAGSDDVELETESVLRSCMVRLPWLFITLLGGFVTSLILTHFQTQIAYVAVLITFVPAILAMGGNTGIQSSTLIVRRIALGDLKGRSIRRLLTRELMVGVLMGSVCGGVIGLWARFTISHGLEPVLNPALLAMIVSIALFSAMTFAILFGAAVPILLDKLGADPAVASGPFVTITNDISALLIYFGVSSLMLNFFLG